MTSNRPKVIHIHANLFSSRNLSCRQRLMTHNAFNLLRLCASLVLSPSVSSLWLYMLHSQLISFTFFSRFFSCIVSLTNEPVHNFAPIQNAVRRHSALLHTTWTDRQHIHFQIVFDELSCAHFFPFISRSHIPFFPLFSFRSITVKLENSIKWNKSIPFALFHLILVNLWFFLFNLFL